MSRSNISSIYSNIRLKVASSYSYRFPNVTEQITLPTALQSRWVGLKDFPVIERILSSKYRDSSAISLSKLRFPTPKLRRTVDVNLRCSFHVSPELNKRPVYKAKYVRITVLRCDNDNSYVAFKLETVILQVLTIRSILHNKTMF